MWSGTASGQEYASATGVNEYLPYLTEPNAGESELLTSSIASWPPLRAGSAGQLDGYVALSDDDLLHPDVTRRLMCDCALDLP